MNTSGTERIGPQDGGALVLGAVETCLVQNTAVLTDEVGRELLQFIPGRTVSRVDYPVKRAVSPDQLEGVDCRLRLNGKGRARGIGTVAWHAVLSGGRVLQGSAYSRLVAATADYRRTWDHYLRQPGVVEVIGKHDSIALEDGYLDVADNQAEAAEGVDIAAIGNKAVQAVHRTMGEKRLDYRTPLNTTPGQLRWAAILQQGGRQTVGIRKENAGKNSYTLRLTGGPDDLKTFVRFAEDLALHIWLLGVAASANEKATRGEASRIVPVFIDELYGLWLPARGKAMRRLWEGVFEVTGYQDRWEIEINRLISKAPAGREAIGYRRSPVRDR
ncbi:SCO2521 family protein [Actinospica robiniae]|uniref:SCO2521 family protein n=1 Tax=Actinospica robiniae TaxID=304901 RepID=UPI00040D8F48|nr:SCO2521 family protein [Actinospica robiniae]